MADFELTPFAGVDYNPLGSYLSSLLSSGGASNRESIIKALLKRASAWKPGGGDKYNRAVSKRRDYLSGRQLLHATEVLSKYYSETSASMIPHVVPLFRHTVDNLATLYTRSPSREVVVNGDVSEADTELLDRHYRAAMFDAELAGAERAATAARVAFVRCSWDDYEQRVVLTRFWSSDVEVICNPNYPRSLARAYALFARVLTDDGVSGDASGGSETWDVWQRTETGWANFTASGDGSSLSPAEIGPQREFSFLPWFSVHYEDPEGVLFPELPTDDIAAADAATAGYSNRDHIIAMQAHKQRYIIGPEADDGRTWKSAPDEIWKLTVGQIGELTSSPPLEAIDKSLQSTIERWLLLNGVSPAQATADPKFMAALTVKLLNSTRDEKRAARIPFAMLSEERHAWPVMRAVIEHYTSDRFSDGAQLRVSFGKLSEMVSGQDEWALSFKLIEAGASTLAKEMVKHGWARNESEAKRQVEENIAANTTDTDTATVDPSTAYNGAQMAALMGALKDGALGQVPRGSVVKALATGFPITEEEADAIVDTIGNGFEPRELGK